MSGTRCHHRAFTLYEVVLAIAILLGAMTVMSKLIATGSRASMRAQLQTQAMLLCQSKLSEVIAGVEPLVSVQGAPFDSTAPGWIWSLDVAPGPRENLLALHVHVVLPGKGPTPRARTSLVRWLRDPRVFQEAVETATVNRQVTAQPGA